MAKGTKVKTKIGNLKYVFITGEGSNQAMKGEDPRMQYVASFICPKDSAAHKHFENLVMAEWDSYKAQWGVKGLPKTNGIKDEMKKDPEGTIDPATEEVKKVPTGNVIIGFKTNTKWPDGKAQVVKVYDRKGTEITAGIQSADWTIGEGSQGVIHGSAMGNNVGGTHKVTLYLAAVQLTKLVKYEGSNVDTEELEGEDLDLGDSVSSILPEDETPDI